MLSVVPVAEALNATISPILVQETGRLFSACVVRVERHGVLVWEMACGSLDPYGSDDPVSVDSLFDLASITKVFVATTFLRLLAQGVMIPDGCGEVLTLQTPVQRVVPEFAGVERAGVTFWHLLTHTSGLPAHAHLYRTAHNRADMLTNLFDVPMEAAPDQQVVYSCLGFILLGEAMRRLSGGQDLDVLVPTLVLEPLGLSTSDATYCPMPHEFGRIAATETCPWRGRRMRGEVHDENAWMMGGVSGNAGLFGTAQAVSRLAALFLAGGIAPQQAGDTRPTRLMSSHLVAQAISTQAEHPEGERRGLGWQLRGQVVSSAGRLFSLDTFGHTGFTGTCIWADPHCGVSVTILTNHVYYGREIPDLLAFRAALNEAAATALDVGTQ